MKRFCLSRTQLTPKEADQRIQNCFQSVSTHINNIHYWEKRIGKKLEFIDVFILGTDKLETPEEFIKMSIEGIDYLRRKIYEDYGRFVEINNRVSM